MKSKAICLNCGKSTEGCWICDNCVGRIVDSMSREDRLRAAKLGMVALVDEATGYEKVRAKDDLYDIYRKYFDG